MLVVDRILQLRDENNLTSKELENKAGLANSSISQWKRGKGSPSLINIVKLASFFNVSSDYILGLSNERDRSSSQFENSLTQDEALLLSIFREAAPLDKFRIIQVCMNARDAVEKRKTG